MPDDYDRGSTQPQTESGGRDGASHHDDVEVGSDFFGDCCRAFGIEDMIHEVFAVGLEVEAAREVSSADFSNVRDV